MHDLQDTFWYEERFTELDTIVLTDALSILDRELIRSTRDQIRTMYDQDGPIRWAMSLDFWIQGLATLLEKELGPGVVPTHNWEDYTVQVAEVFAGKRPKTKRNDDCSLCNTTPDFEESMPIHRVQIYGVDRAIEMVTERINKSIEIAGLDKSEYDFRLDKDDTQVSISATKRSKEKFKEDWTQYVTYGDAPVIIGGKVYAPRNDPASRHYHANDPTSNHNDVHDAQQYHQDKAPYHQQYHQSYHQDKATDVAGTTSPTQPPNTMDAPFFVGKRANKPGTANISGTFYKP